MIKDLTFLLLVIIFLNSCKKDDDRDIIIPHEDIENTVLVLVNAHRRELGLDTLVLNSIIRDKARKHSHNMALEKVSFGHDGFNKRVEVIWDKVGQGSAAENVAYSSSNAETTVNMWLNSDGHRKNIEGDYNLSGIGVVKSPDNERYYYTQIFLKY